MQTEAPEVFDIRQETEAIQKLYGPGSAARGCLLAVRLIESGVRRVQLYYAMGDPWDAHTDIYQHRRNAKESDHPFAAVIQDLKSRGLFDDTLVVCATEFGRTPSWRREEAWRVVASSTVATIILLVSVFGWLERVSKAA